MTGTESLEHNTANISAWFESKEHDYAWKTGNDFESEKRKRFKDYLIELRPVSSRLPRAEKRPTCDWSRIDS